MAKKGTLKPVDAMEQEIRNNAECYSVMFFIPTAPTTAPEKFETLEIAKEHAREQLKIPSRIRSALIYAVTKDGATALEGYVLKNLSWKPVVPARF